MHDKRNRDTMVLKSTKGFTMKQNDAMTMARTQMDMHGLTDWHFEFDGAIRRFGCCHYADKKITLSRTLTEMNNPLHVYDTIMHEIAHALVGHGHGHDAVWKRTAIQIGCDGNMYYDGNAVATPPPKFVGACPNCSHKTYRNQRRKSACGLCCKKYNHGRYTKQFAFTWERNT